MASSGAHLPLWDRNNKAQGGFIMDSKLDEILIQATVRLREELQLDDLWAYLEALGVLKLTDIEDIQHGRSRPRQVEELLKFIRTGGTRWQYHALMRAMALTGQSHLIPGSNTSIYLPVGGATTLPASFTITQQELKGIWDHCLYCKKMLLLSHVFTFEGEPPDTGDDIINLADSIIDVQPNVKDAACPQTHQKMVQIEGNKILEQLGDSSPPVTIRLYADPGDGKTSFARYSVYSWSVNFLKHMKDGKLRLQPGCPKWKLMVFLSCRDVKTTVSDAIRDALGCKKRDKDVLMGVVDDGEWVVVFLDAYDEVRNPETRQKIHDYVRECQKDGGPTVVITCRTNLCGIDSVHFDRFAILSGFTEEQGLCYVKRYTELCQPLLPQPSQAPSVYEYAHQHKDKLKAVLCNPLRLYVFTALALRGEIDLNVAGDFNISMLFVPLERYLLQREGVIVSEEQKHAFYRLCLHALFSDIREFPESLLQEFGVIRAFHVFMVKADRRNSCGKLVAYFTFGHEMVLEYFASRYIFCLNEEERISLLLLICSDRQLRNVQKLVFELLLQDGGQNHIKLLQTMLRFILILQPCIRQSGDEQSDDERYGDEIRNEQYEKMLDDEVLRDLLHLPDCIKTDVPLKDILHAQHGRLTINDAARIHEKIKEAFNCHKLRESAWFTYLDHWDNGTIQHVVSCVQAASSDVQQQLIHNTIHLMLPCKGKNKDGATVWWYAVGCTRWASVQVDAQYVRVYAWCPADAAEVLVQHAATPSGLSGRVVHELCIYTNMYSELWGQPDGDRFTHTQWHNLLQVLPQVGDGGSMEVYLHYTAPVTVLLSCLTQHTVQLAQCEKITVRRGTAELEDLVHVMSACRENGVNVELKDTDIVYTERQSAQGEANNAPVQAGVVQGWVSEWSTDCMNVHLDDTAPVTVLLSCLTPHTVQLAQCGKINVMGGTAELEDLVTVMSACREKGVNVVLEYTNFVYTERQSAQGEANNAPVQAAVVQGKVRWSTDCMVVYLHDTAPVTVLLSWLTQHSVQLAQCEYINVWYGRAELEDLVTVMSACREKGLNVELQGTEFVYTERQSAQGEANNGPVQAAVVQGEVSEWSTDCMEVRLHDTAPVTVLLSWLTQHTVQLAQCGKINVWDGRAELEDLVLCAQRLIQQGVELILRVTDIEVTQSLSKQTHKLHHLKDSLTGVLHETWGPRWVTESGENYEWEDR